MMSEQVIVGDWVRNCPVISPNQMCDDLVSLFRLKKELECVVVCDEFTYPAGLIMRGRFFRMLGSLYGMSLYGNKPVSVIMDAQPLIAERQIDAQELIDRALSREEETFYDAVILTDRGKFVGVLTVNDLLNVSRLMQRIAVSRQMRTIRDTESMIGSINMSVERVAETTIDTRLCSDRIAECTDQGRNELEKMLQLFKMWSEIADRQQQAMEELTGRASQADGIIRLIAELAEQCNLLAINASIEAARAGQSGSGFGVVAGEIRGLADQTKQSAAQITRLLSSMREAVKDAASLVTAGKTGADQGFIQVRQTENIFMQLWSSSAQNHAAAARLIDASNEARETTNEIKQEIHKLAAQMNVTSAVSV
jgi:methyl-accepting chemotaxis protein